MWWTERAQAVICSGSGLPKKSVQIVLLMPKFTQVLFQTPAEKEDAGVWE